MAERKSRVLVADDEEEIRKILSNILEKEGFEVITASDGEQAMQKICFDSPDAVLLDVRMPAELIVESVPGAVNIPLPQLRSRMGELPKDREIHVICRSAQRAYYATRILLQNGFKAKNIAGGMLSRAMRAIAETK